MVIVSLQSIVVDESVDKRLGTFAVEDSTKNGG